MDRWILIGIVIGGGLFLMADSAVVQAARREHDFDELVREASVNYGVPMSLIKAVIRNESGFNPEAVNPSDPSAGLMQTTPYMASQMLGYHVTLEDLKDPQTAITAGTKYLAYLANRYPLDDAIQMYNLGETKFRKGLRAPVYLANVKRYLAYYEKNF